MRTKEECSICGKLRFVGSRTQEGNAVCKNCRSKQIKEECSICGKIKVVTARTQEGKALCDNCRRKQIKEKCSICEKIKIVGSRTQEGNAVCRNCRSKQTKEKCSICGKIKVVAVRTQEGQAICDSCSCWENPERLFKKYKMGALARGYTFTITKEDFYNIIKLPCYYCNRGDVRIGIDRYYNDIGYELYNCRPCCQICNFMKGRLPGDLFINQSKLVAKNHDDKSICEKCKREKATQIVKEIVDRFQVDEIEVCDKCAEEIYKINIKFRN